MREGEACDDSVMRVMLQLSYPSGMIRLASEDTQNIICEAVQSCECGTCSSALEAYSKQSLGNIKLNAAAAIRMRRYSRLPLT